MNGAPDATVGGEMIPIAEPPAVALDDAAQRGSVSPGDFIGYLYRCYDRSGRLIYIGATSDVYQRINVHSRQSVFADRIAEVHYWPFPNVASAREAESRAIRGELPPLNRVGNPMYEGRPKAEQREFFAAELARVPIAGSKPDIRDGRPAEEVAAAARAAMERVGDLYAELLANRLGPAA